MASRFGTSVPSARSVTRKPAGWSAGATTYGSAFGAKPAAASKVSPAAGQAFNVWLWKQAQAKAAAPVASSGPAAAAAPAAMPVDPTYDQQLGASGRTRDTSLAGLTADRSSGLLNYGYTEGPGGALTFDAANPYSQAALMKRHYDQSRRGALNRSAASGQLYAGSAINAQNELDFQQGQSSDALQKALAAFLARNSQQQTAAVNQYDSDASAAAAARWARAAGGA